MKTVTLSSIFFTSLLLTASLASTNTMFDYSCIIDAGSTGSRIWIYRWPHTDTGQRVFVNPQFVENGTKAIRPGVSSFAREPSGIVKYLEPLTDFATRVILAEGVSEGRLQTFHIYFKATAGMRMLNQVARDQIMLYVRAFLAHSPFYFEPVNARVISGEEEGVYGWLSINFARKSLFDDSVGALDLGGASTQMTWHPVHDVVANFFPLRFIGQNIRLYTHSFLMYGHTLARLRLYERVTMVYPRLTRGEAKSLVMKNEAGEEEMDEEDDQEGLVYYQHPCFPPGLLFGSIIPDEGTYYLGPPSESRFIGSGNATECMELAYGLLNKNAPCWTYSCSIAGVYEPRILGSSFVAFSHFAKIVVRHLRLTADASLNEIATAAQLVCPLGMPALRKRFPHISSEEDLGRLCGDTVWIYTLLRHGLGFDPTTRQIHYEERDVDQLGAILYEANLYPWAPPPQWYEDVRLLFLIGVSAMFFTGLIATCVCYCRAKQRLEKQIHKYHRAIERGASYRSLRDD